MAKVWITAAAGVAALAMLVGILDRQSPEITAKHERLVYERKVEDVKPEDRVALSHPIQYDATVTMGAGRTRFYVRGER